MSQLIIAQFSLFQPKIILNMSNFSFSNKMKEKLFKTQRKLVSNNRKNN